MRIKGPISPSGLALFKQCPYKFLLHYSGYPRLPPPPSRREPLDFGKVVHEVIAEYYRTLPDSITPEGAKSHLAAVFRRKWPQTLLYLRQRAEQQLMNFLRFETRRLTWSIDPKPVAVEKEFVKGSLHGIVDALFRTPSGEVIVVDWKTGRGRARLTEDIVFQMNVYMYLTGARRAYAVFLEFGEWYEVRPSIDVETVVNELLRLDSFPRRRGPHCSDCEYQLACLVRRWDPWSLTP